MRILVHDGVADPGARHDFRQEKEGMRLRHSDRAVLRRRAGCSVVAKWLKPFERDMYDYALVFDHGGVAL